MRILVLGSGVSGRAAATLARARGHMVTVYDGDRVDPVGLLDGGVGIVSGAWDPGLLEGVDLVVASPGFSERSLPIVETLERGVPIWSEIEFAWRTLEDTPVVAVTGTNGKTTVTTLTARMLGESGLDAVPAGNIGTALSDVVGQGHQLLVVEVSSFQLRFIERFRADAAAIINVAPDHLDWHGSVAGYEAAKARIFERQRPQDLLVFDADDEGAARLARRAASRQHPVSAHHRPAGGSGVSDGILHVPGLTVPVAELGSRDPAHVVDLAIAAVLALDQGADVGAVAAVMRSFRPGAHRRSVVAVIEGVTYVDDSKATNPHAALAAVAAYPSVVLIAGGLEKGLDLSPLAEAANVRALIGIGTVGPGLAALAGDRGHEAASMTDAVRLAHEVAEAGDTVLLAPGAASFDQYGSYAERGDAFASAVADLTRPSSPSVRPGFPPPPRSSRQP